VTGVEIVIGNCVYLAPLSKYGTSKIMRSWPWPFEVTWRYQSLDHSTPGCRLPISVHGYHASL